MSLAVTKQTLKALCAESGVLKTATDARLAEEIAAVLETLTGQNPTAAPATRPDLFAGRWRLLYSTFKLERETDLTKLSFAALPSARATVEALYQEIWPDRDRAYDNVVDLFDGAGKPIRKVMTGRFDAHSDARLDVEFTRVFVTARDGRDRGALAADLGLPADASLDAPIGKTPPLHSTIVFLDEELRVMRGVYGGVYVLTRSDDPAPPARLSAPAS